MASPNEPGRSKPAVRVYEEVSKRGIKGTIAPAMLYCSCCGNRDSSSSLVKACGQCRNAWYCSRECQKSHWPSHKSKCIAREGPHISKILRAFGTKLKLINYVHIATILHMNLLDNPIRGPFTITVQFNLLPTVEEMGHIIRGTLDPKPKDKLQGCLQIADIIVDTSTPLTSKELSIWQDSRDIFDEDGFSEDPLAWVQLIVESRTGFACATASRISAADFDVARKREPLVYYCPFTRKQRAQELSPESCIQYINSLIREDKDNDLRLQMPLRDLDIRVIKRVRQLLLSPFLDPNEEALDVRALFHRMTVDPIYQVYETRR